MRFLDQRCSRVRRGLDRRPADCPPANRIDNCASRSRTVIVETGSFWKGSYRVLESRGRRRRADAKPLAERPAGSIIWRLPRRPGHRAAGRVASCVVRRVPAGARARRGRVHRPRRPARARAAAPRTAGHGGPTEHRPRRAASASPIRVSVVTFDDRITSSRRRGRRAAHNHRDTRRYRRTMRHTSLTARAQRSRAHGHAPTARPGDITHQTQTIHSHRITHGSPRRQRTVSQDDPLREQATTERLARKKIQTRDQPNRGRRSAQPS